MSTFLDIRDKLNDDMKLIIDIYEISRRPASLLLEDYFFSDVANNEIEYIV